jgi:hypothetical protein
MYRIIKQFQAERGLVDHYQQALEKWLSQSNLDKIRKSLLSRGSFNSCHRQSIGPVLPGFQGNCRVTAEKTAQTKDRYKMKTAVSSSLSCF